MAGGNLEKLKSNQLNRLWEGNHYAGGRPRWH